jgi:mannose-6-phosphate isomerase-like protein (cupin superfamily)
MSKPIRRVVAGVDAKGRSAVIFDSSAHQVDVPGVPGMSATFVWMTHDAPADNRGASDAASGALVFPPKPKGSCFFVFEYPPLSRFTDPAARLRALRGGHSEADGEGSRRTHAGMHKTATVDYIVMISGEITVILEEGAVVLRPGDVFVDRGVYHAWENRGDVPAVFASIAIDAHPL